MNFHKTNLPGLILIEPKVFPDNRGFFMETFQKQRYKEAGIDYEFVQDNLSYSEKGTLRGLHYQYPNSQGKLVSVVYGSVYDVSVDIRNGSPTFGDWYGVEISAENKHHLWIPPGFAHGFCVTSETAVFVYKCTDYYNQQTEHTILWNDDALSIQWPILDPIVAAKDKHGLLLSKIGGQHLPEYQYD